jgi:DNA polymerase III epsilon subunit-like protein
MLSIKRSNLLALSKQRRNTERAFGPFSLGTIMAQPPIPKFGLAIDWETSGYSIPNYAAKHQGISFGALIFDTSDFSIVETMYIEVKFNSSKYEWDAGAEKIHGLSREHLEAHGVSQEEAAQQLAGMILKYMGTDKIVALGHRVHFDIAFTNQLMESVGFELTWDPIKLDSAAFALTFLGVTKSDDLFDMMGMPPRTEHNSLEDVIYTIESIKGIRDFFMKGLTNG